MSSFFNNANGRQPVTSRAKFLVDYTTTFTDSKGVEYGGSWNTGDMVAGKISHIESMSYFVTSKSGIYPDPSGIEIRIPADDESVIRISQLDSTIENIPNQEMRNVQEVKVDNISSANSWYKNPVVWVVGAILAVLGYWAIKK